MHFTFPFHLVFFITAVRACSPAKEDVHFEVFYNLPPGGNCPDEEGGHEGISRSVKYIASTSFNAMTLRRMFSNEIWISDSAYATWNCNCTSLPPSSSTFDCHVSGVNLLFIKSLLHPTVTRQKEAYVALDLAMMVRAEVQSLGVLQIANIQLKEAAEMSAITVFSSVDA